MFITKNLFSAALSHHQTLSGYVSPTWLKSYFSVSTCLSISNVNLHFFTELQSVVKKYPATLFTLCPIFRLRRKQRNRDYMSKKFADSCLFLPSIFLRTQYTPERCREFFADSYCKHSLSIKAFFFSRMLFSSWRRLFAELFIIIRARIFPFR